MQKLKNYRFFVPIVLIALMGVSWILLVKDAVSVEKQFNSYLAEARKHAENGTKYAIENYELALNIKDDISIYVEVADYYKNQGKGDEYLSWCKFFFEEYPTQKEAYDCVLNAYLENKDYESCYDILEIAQKRNISSDYINKVSDEIKYVYKLDFNTYEDVGIYSNNYCSVASKGFWGFVDRYGKQRVACKYKNVGAYTQTNFTSVVSSDNEAYFIDKTGAKVLASKEKYIQFGLLVDNVITAKRADGKYIYVNSKFENLFGEYDYASTMNNGIAAVKQGDEWKIVDKSGNNVIEKSYADVILDEKQIVFRCDRMFVATEAGKYVMVDGSGKQIGTLVFEDAKLFSSAAPTAVKMDGKWCYVDIAGEKISDKTYNEARPFANGLAAVCINGKWGFIDETENIVIEPIFFGAKDFNEKGSCFVQTGDKWQLLKLYRLNRNN